MPTSNYVYISGEAIDVGSHGDTSYFYQSGDPVPNYGQSGYVYESGVGLGGGPVIFEGVNVGYFETAETHEEWYGGSGYDGTGSVSGSDTVKGSIRDRDSEYLIYLFVHHDSANDSWAFGSHMSTSDSNASSYDAVYNLTLDGFGGYWLGSGDPVVADDPSTADHNDYSTTSDGDPVAGMGWSWDTGDGFMYEFSPDSFSFTVQIEEANGTFWTATDTIKEPAYIRGRGTDANTDKDHSDPSTTFDVSLNLPP